MQAKSIDRTLLSILIQKKIDSVNKENVNNGSNELISTKVRTEKNIILNYGENLLHN